MKWSIYLTRAWKSRGLRLVAWSSRWPCSSRSPWLLCSLTTVSTHSLGLGVRQHKCLGLVFSCPSWNCIGTRIILADIAEFRCISGLLASVIRCSKTLVLSRPCHCYWHQSNWVLHQDHSPPSWWCQHKHLWWFQWESGSSHSSAWESNPNPSLQKSLCQACRWLPAEKPHDIVVLWDKYKYREVPHADRDAFWHSWMFDRRTSSSMVLHYHVTSWSTPHGQSAATQESDSSQVHPAPEMTLKMTGRTRKKSSHTSLSLLIPPLLSTSTPPFAILKPPSGNWLLTWGYKLNQLVVAPPSCKLQPILLWRHPSTPYAVPWHQHTAAGARVSYAGANLSRAPALVGGAVGQGWLVASQAASSGWS